MTTKTYLARYHHTLGDWLPADISPSPLYQFHASDDVHAVQLACDLNKQELGSWYELSLQQIVEVEIQAQQVNPDLRVYSIRQRRIPFTKEQAQKEIPPGELTARIKQVYQATFEVVTYDTLIRNDAEFQEANL